MVLDFIKMHGIGNDYVCVDAFGSPRIERLRLPDLARQISDRHTGVGADGLILVCRPSPAGAREVAHARMRMFNADGSEAEMCGNGVRCVAKFVHDHLGIRHTPLLIETGAGVLAIRFTARAGAGKLATATVDMGVPVTRPALVPVDMTRAASSLSKATGRAKLALTPHPFQSLLRTELGWMVTTFVSMGNPHAVVFVDGGPDGAGANASAGKPSARQPAARSLARLPDDLHALDLTRIGPSLERHSAFPNRANIHFARVISRRRVQMRTWERGSGITLACGTGACAVLVAGVLNDLLHTQARVDLPGGSLRVRWDIQTQRVFLTGPATESFRGTWPG